MSKYNLNLNLIRDMIKRIESDSNKSLEDKTVWDAMLMRFQVIGENIDKLPREILKKHGEINWKKFYACRNLISHVYNDVPIEVIMELITELSVLKKVIGKIRGELK
jgi:uncharacterized protein with HEPN domain